MADEKDRDREPKFELSTEGPDAPAARLLRSREKAKPASILTESHAIWQGDALEFLKGLPERPLFDLIVTSPPYNIGKSYETRQGLDEYIAWQETIVDEVAPRLRPGGSLCWQVGRRGPPLRRLGHDHHV